MIAFLALLPAISYLVVIVAEPATVAITTLIAYSALFALFLRVDSLVGLRGFFILGVIHGAALALISAAWVWTFKGLPIPVVVVVAGIAGLYYGLVFALVAFCTKMLRVRFTGSAGAILVCLVLATVFAGAEVLRSASPHLFIPLATLPAMLATGPGLSIASLISAPGLGFVGFLASSGLALIVVMLRSKPVMSQAVPGLIVLGVILAAKLGFAAIQSTAATDTIHEEFGTVCAFTDIGRRNRQGDNSLSARQIELQAKDAQNSYGCDTIAFPESTGVVARDKSSAPVTPSDQPLVIAGLRMVDEVIDGNPAVFSFSTNSLCDVVFHADGLSCRASVDKRYLAPFVESELFHMSEKLKPIGAILTRALTGDGNTDTARQTGSVLELPGERRLGSLICLELFIPLRRQLDASGTARHVPLVVVPMDHSAFPAWDWIARVKEQSVRLQAAVANTPLLLVSTEMALLMMPNGKSVKPDLIEGDLYVWNTAPIAGARQ